MKSTKSSVQLSRRNFGREVATLAGTGVAGTSALLLAPTGATQADEGTGKGYFAVDKLPFHLQHEFTHSISCNNAIAKAEEIDFRGEETHAVQQRPQTFGWGTITFFLRFHRRLVGKDMQFFSTVGWNGKAEGEVIFGVEINGDIIIDGARSVKNKWIDVSRVLPVKSEEMRVTLMLDSIRGNNDFSFWWAEPQLTEAKGPRQ